MGAGGRETISIYGESEDAVRPVLQIAMPRLPCLYAPGGTMHVAASFSAEKERLNPLESNSSSGPGRGFGSQP